MFFHISYNLHWLCILREYKFIARSCVTVTINFEAILLNLNFVA